MNMGISAEASLITLAKMFENFMQLQTEKGRRQEKEAIKHEQKLGILNHQITKLHQDLETDRAGRPSAQAIGVLAVEPTLQRIEDSDDSESFLTTFKKLAMMCICPQHEWAVCHVCMRSSGVPLSQWTQQKQ